MYNLEKHKEIPRNDGCQIQASRYFWSGGLGAVQAGMGPREASALSLCSLRLGGGYMAFPVLFSSVGLIIL